MSNTEQFQKLLGVSASTPSPMAVRGIDRYEMGAIPVQSSQKNWRYLLTKDGDSKMIHLDGGNGRTFSFRFDGDPVAPEHFTSGTPIALTRLGDSTRHDKGETKGETVSKGVIQVHKSTPTSIHATLQDGKNNSTLMFEQGDGGWTMRTAQKKKRLPEVAGNFAKALSKQAIEKDDILPFSKTVTAVQDASHLDRNVLGVDRFGGPGVFPQSANPIRGFHPKVQGAVKPAPSPWRNFISTTPLKTLLPSSQMDKVAGGTWHCPENYDTLSDSGLPDSSWVMYVGCNDWEGGVTWAAVYRQKDVTKSGVSSAVPRAWVEIDHNDCPGCDSREHASSRRSDCDTKCNDFGRKVARRWVREANQGGSGSLEDRLYSAARMDSDVKAYGRAAQKTAGELAYGYPVISPEEAGVADFLKKNPHVAGMAWGGGENGSDAAFSRSVVVNPHNQFMGDATKRSGLLKIEAARHLMGEEKYIPGFDLAPGQQAWRKKLGGPYATNDGAFKQSIVSRLMAGDEVPDATPEQIAAADEWSKKLDARVGSAHQIKEAGAASYLKVLCDKFNAARKDVHLTPSEAQRHAGNYSKGHVWMNGFDITIENPKGSTRSGTARDGTKWKTTLAADYGDIRNYPRSKADGDNMDVFVGPHPSSEMTYVIDQYIDDKFDEHKIVLGCFTEKEAKAIYQGSFDENWKGMGDVTALTIRQLKSWLKEGDTSKPLHGQSLAKHVKTAMEECEREEKLAADNSWMPAPVASVFNNPLVSNTGLAAGSGALRGAVVAALIHGVRTLKRENLDQPKRDLNLTRDLALGSAVGAGSGLLLHYTPEILEFAHNTLGTPKEAHIMDVPLAPLHVGGVAGTMIGAGYGALVGTAKGVGGKIKRYFTGEPEEDHQFEDDILNGAQQGLNIGSIASLSGMNPASVPTLQAAAAKSQKTVPVVRNKIPRYIQRK